MADMSKINFNIDGVNNEFDIKDKKAREEISINKSDILKAENDIAINRATLGIQCNNIFDGNLRQGVIQPTDGIFYVADDSVASGNFIKVSRNATISISRTTSSGYLVWRFYDKDKNYIGYASEENVQIISGGSGLHMPSANSKFACYKLVNPNIMYAKFVDITNDITNTYTIVEGEYTEDTMPSYEPYTPSLQEQINNKISRTYGAASSNDSAHVLKWYKLGRFETITQNNTFNSIFLVHDRKGRENGLLTITIERRLSEGIVSPFVSIIQAEWISAEYQTNSNYRKENNFVVVAWVENTKLICELWCRIAEAWGCYHALKLVDNRMTYDVSTASSGSETGWIMEKTSTPYDNHPEASDTVRVVQTVDRLALALRPTTINYSKDNPIGRDTEIVLTRPYTDFNVLTITLNTTTTDDTSTRHIIDIPVQGITYASRYMIVCGSETGTVRFDKSGTTGNIKMISSSFEELYVISVDGRK